MATPHLARASAALTALALTAACGGPQVTDAPPPAKVAAPAAPQEPDAYRDHAGPHAKAGELFRLKDTAYAIDGAGVVVALVRAAWTKRKLDDGREVREGSAEVAVSRGEVTERRILEQGEAKTWLGVRVEVKGAGEDYDEQRLNYIPWVELQVTAAP